MQVSYRQKGVLGYLAGPLLAHLHPPMPAPPSPVEAAAALLGDGRAVEAAALLKPYAEHMAGYAGALVVYARALERAGDVQGALAAWHRAHFFAPDSPLVRRERTRLLRQSDPLADAAPESRIEPPHPAGRTFQSAPDADLDALIQQLEHAPRIRPDDAFDEPDLAETQGDDEVISETMAAILAAQGQRGEAARIYETLADQRPADAARLREKAHALRSQAKA